MGFRPGEENQSSNIRKAIEEAGLDMGAVWIAYFTMGGNAGTWEVEAYIGGALSLPALERDILAQAINELIDELPPRRKATFSDEGADVDHGALDDAVGRALTPSQPPADRPETAEGFGNVEGTTIQAPSEQDSAGSGDRGGSAGRSGYGSRFDDDGESNTRQRHGGEGREE